MYIYTYAVMKTVCTSSYHHNSPVATHAFGHIIYGLITKHNVPK